MEVSQGCMIFCFVSIEDTELNFLKENENSYEERKIRKVNSEIH